VVESVEQSGRPLSNQNEEVVAKVHDLVRAVKRLTIKEVAKEQGISSDLCKGILTKHLGLRHVSAKFVPWLLTVKQKERHLSCSL